MELLTNIVPTDTYGTRSGNLPNPGKRLFLKLAADAVRDVNRKIDEYGVSYDRKDMLRCGLVKQDNGLWETRNILPHLQTISNKFPENFNELDPNMVLLT